jgi:hypothetical protein
LVSFSEEGGKGNAQVSVKEGVIEFLEAGGEDALAGEE